MPLVALDPSLPPICGYARTATIRAVTPPQGDAKAIRAAYYTYVAEGAFPILVQDLDPEPGFGAFWGEVNTTVHKGLGCLGCITNGSFRDLDASAPGFQILGGKVGPSHGWVHPVDFGVPVNVGGMAVNHDDIIHADRHGAVVVPASAVKTLPDAISLLERREKVIIDAARSPDFDIHTLKAAWPTPPKSIDLPTGPFINLKYPEPERPKYEQVSCAGRGQNQHFRSVPIRCP